jgi:hypothetical protein
MVIDACFASACPKTTVRQCADAIILTDPKEVLLLVRERHAWANAGVYEEKRSGDMVQHASAEELDVLKAQREAGAAGRPGGTP